MLGRRRRRWSALIYHRAGVTVYPVNSPIVVQCGPRSLTLTQHIYRVFIEECGSQSLNLPAVFYGGIEIAKRGMLSTDEIGLPGYSMIIFQTTGNETNVYIKLR